MNAWKLLGLFAGSVGILLSTTACEVSGCGEEEEEDADGQCIQLKSLKKFTGNTKTTDWIYAAGRNIVIDSNNGSVEVRVGSKTDAGSIETTPFVFRAYDTSDEIVSSSLEGISHVVSGEPDINVESGGGGNKGVDTLVILPANFSGKIAIRQNNGGIDIDGVASAVNLEVLSDNGSCEIQSSATVQNTKVDCDNGSTLVYGLSNTVDIDAGNGDLDVSFDAVGGSGGTLDTGNGDINISIPLAAQFSIQATAGQTVDMGNPSGCTVQEAAVNSKTVSCGDAGGPNYVANASSLGDVIVRYR